MMQSFPKIQDVYNFIRGYWEWMRVSGYDPSYDGNPAYDFVEWAITAEVGFRILTNWKNFKIQTTKWTCSEYNTLVYNNNSVLAK